MISLRPGITGGKWARGEQGRNGWRRALSQVAGELRKSGEKLPGTFFEARNRACVGAPFFDPMADLFSRHGSVFLLINPDKSVHGGECRQKDLQRQGRHGMVVS